MSIDVRADLDGWESGRGDLRPVLRPGCVTRDRKFESAFLQRGVSCEPDFRSESLDPRILA
jgi:hypothetical protein